MTHPFHPWTGQEFMFLSVGHNWGEDRVFFLDDDDVHHSLPVGWTDAASLDVFVTVAAGRSPFRVEDLTVLAGLVAQPRENSDASTGKLALRPRLHSRWHRPCGENLSAHLDHQTFLATGLFAPLITVC
ncbi:MAG: DUF5372 family protein [Acidimicrobiales bacterium]